MLFRIRKKVKNANESSNYITEDNILDKDDLNKYFLAFKQYIIKNHHRVSMNGYAYFFVFLNSL